MSPVRFIMFSFLQAFYTLCIRDSFLIYNGARIGDAFEDGMTKTAYILLDFEKSSYQYLLIHCCSTGLLSTGVLWWHWHKFTGGSLLKHQLIEKRWEGRAPSRASIMPTNGFLPLDQFWISLTYISRQTVCLTAFLITEP